MSDLTIDDLAADEGATVESGGSGDGGDSAEWVTDLIDRLDEKGVLDALIAQQVGADPEALAAEAPAVEADHGGADAAEAGIGADDVARIGKVVIDQYGDVPISQVVKAAESDPEAVEEAINAALGAGGDPA
jgi:hypothetical protein